MNLLDLIFPKTCVGCNKKGMYFCPSCVLKIKKIPQICPACERASPFGQTHGYCYKRNSLNGLFSLYLYDGTIRSAVHQLKYKFVTDLESEFWTLIKESLINREEETVLLRKYISGEKVVVIPVPLFWHKENLRGFNQSSLFGKRLSDYFKIPFSDKILVRPHNVNSQTKLTRIQRSQNVKGIFSISPKIHRSFPPTIHNSLFNILLVDDVWTTGSTMKETAKTLKEAGIKKVWGLTIAR